MGYEKEKNAIEMEKDSVAEYIALEVGYLEKCFLENCIFIPDGLFDLEAVYKRANQLITNDDPSVAIFKGVRPDLTDRIRDLPFSGNYGMECTCPQ